MRWGPQARYSHGFHHPELPNEPDDGFHRPTESTMPASTGVWKNAPISSHPQKKTSTKWVSEQDRHQMQWRGPLEMAHKKLGNWSKETPIKWSYNLSYNWFFAPSS